MSYEVEAIASSTAAIPTELPPILKEERVLDPYKTRTVKQEPGTVTKEENFGRSDTNKESVAAEEAKPTTEEAVKLSPQVAALARKEQKYRQQQQELDRDRKAIEAEKAELAELKALKAKLAAKDYSGLDGMVDYNDYSQYQIDRLNGSDPVNDEIKSLKSEIDEIKKSSQENISKQFEAAVSERRIAANKLIEESAAFPRIKKAKAQEAVVKHILDTWEHDSKELSVEDAAKEVEEILVEKAKQWAALLEEEKKEPAEEEKKQLPPLKQGLKTLTNQVTAGEIKRPQKSFQHMSDSERWAEARRRAEEKLQQQKGR